MKVFALNTMSRDFYEDKKPANIVMRPIRTKHIFKNAHATI